MDYIEAIQTVETYLDDLCLEPLECSECGKIFFMVKDRKIISRELLNEKIFQKKCDDHVSWDLILDPDFQAYVCKSKKIIFLDQEQIQESYFKAGIFLVDRLN